jgi:hypothetical protein
MGKMIMIKTQQVPPMNENAAITLGNIIAIVAVQP